MENEVLTDAIETLETTIQKYPANSAVIPWGDMRDTLIKLSESLKLLRRNMESLADLVHLREVEDDENLDQRSQFE